jgi:DNA polymerase-1
VIKFKQQVADQAYDCFFVERPEDNKAALENLVGSKSLAVDTESTGLRPLIDKDWRLRLVQIYNGKEVWLLRPEISSEVIKKILAGSSNIALFNAPFDTICLQVSGLIDWESFWRKVTDVRSMAHLLDNRGRAIGGCPLDLKSLSYYLINNWSLDGVLWKLKQHLKIETVKMIKAGETALGRKLAKDEHWAACPIDNMDYLRYSALDALWTGKLAGMLGRSVIERGLSHLLTRERRLARICATMTLRGFLTDEAYVNEARLQAMADTAEMRQAMQEQFGEVGLSNPRSSKQVFRAYALLDGKIPRDEKGKISAAKSIIGDWDDPLSLALMEFRAEDKCLSGTLTPLTNLVDSEGRVHTEYRTLGTVTGRMAASGPNLQQMPKRRNTARKYRSCLQADEGKIIVSADLSQIEYRVAADRSGDPGMIAAYQNGLDLHEEAARLLFSTGTFAPTEAQRDLAKSCGFGKIYFAGPGKIARTGHVSMDMARELIRQYDSLYSGLAQWSKGQLQTALNQMEAGENPGVTTLYGRDLLIDASRPYVIVNYQVQSAARDILVDWLFLCEDQGILEGNLLALVHDEIVLQCAPEDGSEVAHILEQTASAVDSLTRVPNVAEAKVGTRSWGSLFPSDTKVQDLDRGDLDSNESKEEEE